MEQHSQALKKIKCAIVGYGYMGKIRQSVAESIDTLELIGIYDADDAIRGQIEGARTFSSLKDVLKSEAQIIFVCTPNRYSPEICIQSMQLGKHVFCEKPPGRNLDDIRDIMKAEKEQDGRAKLMFGFNHRFHPGILKAKAIVDSGRMGQVVCLRGIYGKSGGVNFQKSWRNDKTISGGGILLDQGIHMMDLFRYFCGDFEQVKAFASNNFWKFEMEDNAFVILQNKKKQTAFCHSSATFWKHSFRINIIMEEGYLIVEGLLSKTGSYGREKLIIGRRQFEDETHAVGNPSEEVTYFDRDLSWNLEVEEFIRCVEGNKPVAVSSSEDAYKVMEMIDKAYHDAGLSLWQGKFNEEHSRF